MTPSGEYVEDAVRQLLSVRGVRLQHTPNNAPSPGFSLLGVAERVPEFGEISGNPVNVWHIQSNLLPVSMAEFERWVVDAPQGRHWILSERRLPAEYGSILPTGLDVVVWGPNDMSVWLGEAILSGELKVTSRTTNLDVTHTHYTDEDRENHDMSGSIKPIVEIESWLTQKGYEGVLTTPVLLNCIIWEVEGVINSPSGETEYKKWMVLEDPWASTISIFHGFDNSSISPSLRVVNPPLSKWKGTEEMKSLLPSILDSRRQGKTEDNEGSVRSIMLEWWRLDVKSTKISPRNVGIPAWIIKLEGMEDTVLHGLNGRTYPIV